MKNNGVSDKELLVAKSNKRYKKYIEKYDLY